MNYELAKKLKDSGFPYFKQLHRAYKSDGSFRTIGEGNEEEFVFEPTLSELIEACKGKFSALLVGPGLDLWTAKGNGLEVHGSTPEEAVALLWLFLNKK